VAGHSQGGHAALFTHQLFDPSIGVRLMGSVAIAPGLGSAGEWASHFASPSRPMGGLEALALMSLYSHMLYAGAPAPEAWLLPNAQAKLPALFHDFCQPHLPAVVAASFPTLGDVYQPSFLAAAARCKFASGCPDFEPWATALAAEQPGKITSAVPSLVLHGLADLVVSPASVACIVDRMKARGTPVQACGYAGADHFNVLSSAVPDMVRWIGARRAGATPAPCAAPLAAQCAEPISR
jgi:acetyl esterase/lipase